MNRKPLIVVLGPTATGKSDLAVAIAKKWNGEVISADSRQVYTGLDIGTGKITHSEMKGIAHHLLDIANPNVAFNVSEYKKLADKIIKDIHNRGKVPILCGGTGFYIEAVVDGIELPDAPPNAKLRYELNNKSIEELLVMLESLDAERAHEIDPNNKRRVIRAIEVAEMLGKVPRLSRTESKYNVIEIGLNDEPDIIRKRIHARLIKRIDGGMIEEARNLHEKGLSFERMDELGLEYRYLAKYLKGDSNKEEMIIKLNTEIWRYAKRQLTWFRRNKRIQWFKPNETDKIFKQISNHFDNIPRE